MTRLALAIAFVVGLTWSASPARAGGDVGVIVTGDGSLQPQVAAQLDSWLSQHGYTLVPSPLPADAINTLIDCFVTDTPGCARELIEKRSKTSSVVYARVDIKNNANGPRDVQLTAYWFDKGKEAAPQRKTCERCTDQTLRVATDDVMKRLVGGGDTGHVKLSSNPPGARISIDGQAIGVTPLDWDLPPGQHIIQMDKAGLKPASRAITVASNKIDAVGLVLLPLAGPGSGDASDSKPSKLLPLGALVAGGALIVTGGILIAVDQDPGPNSPYKIHNTAPLGVGLLVGGVVVGAVGTYLMWFRSPHTSTPVAAATSDSAYVGWAGTF